MKKIKIGMVCPYGWDTPGGVQTHIRELTQHLLDEGHQVSVFAPVSNEENISDEWLVNAGKPISIPVIARALWASVSEEFVSELEHGIDTIVGERGISLSGGQRQRIALARAIASGRQTLLLDDTTSALDPATESLVIDRLASLSDTTTVVIVASRPTTIKIADHVLFIHDGFVHELSTHDELMRTSPAYSNLMLSFDIDRKAS